MSGVNRPDFATSRRLIRSSPATADSKAPTAASTLRGLVATSRPSSPLTAATVSKLSRLTSTSGRSARRRSTMPSTRGSGRSPRVSTMPATEANPAAWAAKVAAIRSARSPGVITTHAVDKVVEEDRYLSGAHDEGEHVARVPGGVAEQPLRPERLGDLVQCGCADRGVLGDGVVRSADRPRRLRVDPVRDHSATVVPSSADSAGWPGSPEPGPPRYGRDRPPRRGPPRRTRWPAGR